MTINEAIAQLSELRDQGFGDAELQVNAVGEAYQPTTITALSDREVEIS